MSIKTDLLTLFETQNELSIKEITDRLSASKQMVHIVMRQLLDNGFVEKYGRTPKTVYRFQSKNKVEKASTPLISEKERRFLAEEFLVVTETGKLLESIEGFDYWCKKRNLNTQKTLKEFIDTKKKQQSNYNKQGNINGFEKLKNTKGYDKIHLDYLFYLDFYAIERYGKTRLGTLLHFAKQGQNKFLMKLMMDEIRERIISFVKHSGADSIGFVPPTIRREVQIMKFIQNNLQIPLPIIEIKKLSGIIPIPQKSLSKLDERIVNAENTFMISDKRTFKHIILIDDAIGSGATLNQIAGKIKNKKVAEKVTGLAIVGSLKGFDVLTDV